MLDGESLRICADQITDFRSEQELFDVDHAVERIASMKSDDDLALSRREVLRLGRREEGSLGGDL